MGNCGGRDESDHSEKSKSTGKPRKIVDGTVGSAFEEWASQSANAAAPERDERETITAVLTEITTNNRFKVNTCTHLCVWRLIDCTL
jgi:hypothetical protein